MVPTGRPLRHGAATPIDLSAAWNASDERLAGRLHPLYGRALARLPGGDAILRGLPFRLGRAADGPRWVVLDRPIRIGLPDAAAASHVVVAHFCDARHDAEGGRPEGIPVGWVEPIGEPLARYTVTTMDGERVAVVVRRRFEIDEGILGWGALPFLAVGHRAEEAIDWRGPHPRQSPGRYASTGHAGPMTVLPGGWGPAQTGVADFVPSADDDIMLWLHAIPLGRSTGATELWLEPAGAGGPGGDVVIAAISLFDGTADPLLLEPRRQVLVRGRGPVPPSDETDLGLVIRSRPLIERPASDRGPTPGPIGWGTVPPAAGLDAGAGGTTDGFVVDLALARDAHLVVDGWDVPAAAIGIDPTVRPLAHPDGGTTIQALPATDRRVSFSIVDADDGLPTPCRVRFTDRNGRYLPPLGHRDEVNPGLYEDTGADLVLGRDTYAYVPGMFEIDLPPDSVEVEVVKGFDHRPIRTTVEVDAAGASQTIRLERPIDLRPGGWVTADAHVHFLAPSTALLQAAGEDIEMVHLLATQWGDHMTSVNDLPWGSMVDPTGRHRLVVGTENRQVVLGHLGLLGARRPVLPMASGGPPEGRIGGAVTELLADWADRCHAEDGLVVAAHFPLPYAEIAADIVTGRIDAVEMQCFAPGLDNPSILEWYRFLSCGYRLPVMGGTDKMSAEVPVGAVRTYARLDPGHARTFEKWAAAVRAGRTFASSGPVIELSVEGREPGDVIALPASGGRLAVRAVARAAQPMITAVELVVNGRVVAAETVAGATDLLELATSIDVDSGSWIAARSRSDRQIRSAFATSMAAHTSPVYVEVVDRPLFVADQAGPILEVIEGTRAWLATMAAVGRPADRQRMTDFLSATAASFRARLERARREVEPR